MTDDLEFAIKSAREINVNCGWVLKIRYEEALAMAITENEKLISLQETTRQAGIECNDEWLKRCQIFESKLTAIREALMTDEEIEIIANSEIDQVHGHRIGYILTKQRTRIQNILDK